MRVGTLQIRSFLKVFNDALKGKEKSFTSGSINRAIVMLSVPTVLEMVMESLFTFFDLYFVSKIGAGAIAINGTTAAVITFAFSVAIGLSIAGTTLVSRRIGEKKFKKAGATAMQIIYLGFAISLLTSIFCIVFYEQILTLVGLEASLIEEAEIFAKIMFASIVFIVLRISINGILRGAGNASIAMRTLWISNIINIVLSPILIFGLFGFPKFGIVGVALGSLVARVIGVVYQAWYIIKAKTILTITKSELTFSKPIVKKVLKLSSTGAIQYMIPASSWIFMVKIVSHFGANALAGYFIARQLASIATTPAWGFGNAAGVLTGQNLGAKQYKRAEKSVWKAGFFNTCFLIAIAILWRFLAVPAVSLFTNKSIVLTNGVLYLNYITMGYVLLGYTMVISRSLNAAGDVKVVTWLYVLMFYITQIPLAYFLGVHVDWGPKGIFSAILISEFVLAIACILVFKKGKWKYIKV